MAADHVSILVLCLITLWAILFLILSSDVAFFAVFTVATALSGALVITWRNKRADGRMTWKEALFEPPRGLSSVELVSEIQTSDPRQRLR